MSDNNNGTFLLKEKDFVAVVDEEGNELDYKVPKHWGQDQLAAGVTKKGRSSGRQSSGQQGDEEPGGNASRDAWVTYATEVKGAKEGDLVDDDGKDLTRDELAAKYGTPVS